MDQVLGGGLERGAVHEIYATGPQDLSSAAGFTTCLAIRAAGRRPVVWIRQDFLDVEAGSLHAPGLAELGLDPSGLVLVRAHDMTALMRAARDSARCNALGVVVIEPWAEAPDLTASRRLSLAAEESGVTTLLILSGIPVPSAAQTRWTVQPARSQALEASAPGSPAFLATLQRHRGGAAGLEWRVEWDRDSKCFKDGSARRHAPPLSRPVVSVPAVRPFAARKSAGLRRAG